MFDDFIIGPQSDEYAPMSAEELDIWDEIDYNDIVEDDWHVWYKPEEWKSLPLQQAVRLGKQ